MQKSLFPLNQGSQLSHIATGNYNPKGKESIQTIFFSHYPCHETPNVCTPFQSYTLLSILSFQNSLQGPRDSSTYGIRNSLRNFLKYWLWGLFLSFCSEPEQCLPIHQDYSWLQIYFPIALTADLLATSVWVHNLYT